MSDDEESAKSHPDSDRLLFGPETQVVFDSSGRFLPSERPESERKNPLRADDFLPIFRESTLFPTE